ncbi:uncharacterized protein LOC112505862 [Cynara cardunculus var. scolymus]|uniref:uncharacterized protein LOC112505862 n=1 Tax=Cynara cardunculus var. scolymus TaxID=59895 RepID=UPI000D62C461|nr:uncharacterized protein LOC112505862 [Cynara cardunculus var. scolymus]
MEIEKVDKDKEETQLSGIKKQVRRRLHSSKPYQERLLNMAEARREIATALKFHRASMKQQQGAANHQLQTHPPSEQLSTTTASNNYSALSCPPPIPHHYPISAIVPPPPPPPLHHEHLHLALPNQTLGLNLNFQDFNNLNTSIYHTPMSVAAKEVAEVAANSSGGIVVKGVAEGDVVVGGLHDAMESDEMKEVRSLNLVMSTQLCNSLNTIEIGPEKVRKAAGSDHEDDVDGYHPFEQVMEFPPWLINANDSSCFQEVLDHHFSDEYSPDPALPWMDIGEIEGMDGEWLA